ncbi:MAG TPA: helix-turn-helix domain-containing protein [Pyrinomonadaceae bacterium]|nr:helix-turn-helix domain-containing protein [Pyrinomonadaceae bacterium]
MGLYFEGIEQDLLRNALAINNNNRTRAAQQLGISRSGLIKKLNRIANRIGALIIQHWFIFAPKWLFLNHAFVNLSRRSVHCDHALQFDFDQSDLFDLLPGRNLAIIKT